MTTEKEPFDPSKYIVKLRGKDYIEVKYRLMWFRDRYPLGSITTEILSHEPRIAMKSEVKGKLTVDTPYFDNASMAVVKASVFIPAPGDEDGLAILLATGIGMEEKGDFGDYLEKAETKAIGRALGVAGFGTQFSEDLSFASDDKPDAVVDSPVSAPVLPNW